MKENNFLVIQSVEFHVDTFLDRVEKILNEKGVKIFARINHAQAARDVGLSMQDEEVLFFGNPKIGTALMNENPYIGIELPLKILAWRDKEKTLVAYQDLDKLAEIFRIKTSLATINMLKQFMEKLIKLT
jgi:uncharacterized protein (DUF302 family)